MSVRRVLGEVNNLAVLFKRIQPIINTLLESPQRLIDDETIHRCELIVKPDKFTPVTHTTKVGGKRLWVRARVPHFVNAANVSTELSLSIVYCTTDGNWLEHPLSHKCGFTGAQQAGLSTLPPVWIEGFVPADAVQFGIGIRSSTVVRLSIIDANPVILCADV
jgi:hypothetical protein